MTTWRVLLGDVRERLRELPAQSVQTCVTSPPYWGLRDYGHTGQIGLESSPDAYVSQLRDVFREVRRVLRDDGTLWVNLGDSYNNRAKVRESSHQPALNNFQDDVWRDRAARGDVRMSITDGDLKEKDLVGVPWMVAFALRADGWYLRSDIIWSKPNPMPESVTDRPTKAHEYLFLLSKNERYFYDAEAIREAGSGLAWNSAKSTLAANGVKNVVLNQTGQRRTAGSDTFHPDEDQFGRNKRSVWTVTTQPYPEAHFATYPEDLIEPCILAGTSEKGQCPQCGSPWVRVMDQGELVRVREGSNTSGGSALVSAKGKHGASSIFATGEKRVRSVVGWQPSCSCNAGDPISQIVLDPFTGSGTTGAVAVRHQRSFIGVELNPSYLELARKRIGAVSPLFASEVA